MIPTRYNQRTLYGECLGITRQCKFIFLKNIYDSITLEVQDSAFLIPEFGVFAQVYKQLKFQAELRFLHSDVFVVRRLNSLSTVVFEPENEMFQMFSTIHIPNRLLPLVTKVDVRTIIEQETLHDYQNTCSY